MAEPSEKTASSHDVVSQTACRVYASPKLTLLGDLRDLTLGGSVGSGESGNELTRFN